MFSSVGVEIEEGSWVAAAENVTECRIYKLLDTPFYRQAVVNTGDDPPETDELGVLWEDKEMEHFSTSAVDIYLRCYGGDGKVRVDREISGD